MILTLKRMPEKRIYLYDKNIPSGLMIVYGEARKQGIKIENPFELEYLLSAPDLLIINPTSSVVDEERIKKYISENPEVRILYFAPVQSDKKIGEITSKGKNLEVIAGLEQEFNLDLLRKEIGIDPNKI